MGKPVVSTIIDDSDQLNRAVSWYSLTGLMPKRQNTEWAARRPGSFPQYVLAETAKQCGFGVEYPGYKGRYFIRGHMVGSLWFDHLAEEGAIITAEVDEVPNGHLNFVMYPSNGVIGLGNGIASWDTPDQQVAATGLWIDVETMWFDHDTEFSTGLRFNHDTVLQLIVEDQYFSIATGPGAPTDVRGGIHGKCLLGLYYPPKAGQKIWARVNDEFYETKLTRTSNDNRLVDSIATQRTTSANAPIFLRKTGEGIVRDLTMGRMPAGSTVETWKRFITSRRAGRVRYDFPWSEGRYIPAADNITGKEAINTITQPFCISAWIDGDGVLNFVSGDRLRSAGSQLTLNEGDYEPLEWESRFTHAASSLVIKGQRFEVTRNEGGWPTLTVWQGHSSEGFEQSRTMTEFFTVPDGEDYFEVDTYVKNLHKKFEILKSAPPSRSQQEWFADWWREIGSVFSIARKEENTVFDVDPRGFIPSRDIFCDCTRISKRTYKLVYGFKSNWVPGSKPAMSPYIAEHSYMQGSDNQPMPILRAAAKIIRHDVDPLRATTGGPPGPELIHDMGVYLGYDDGQRMLETLKSYFATDHPVFKDVTCVFNPAIDVGVKLTIDASRTWGSIFDVLVTSVQHDAQRGTTTFTPRVVSYRGAATTWERISTLHNRWVDAPPTVTYDSLRS
ncbi:hypothetical protein ACIGDM_00935 [Rothia koreensis]|uniref:hypothetical protein n=1 Tax=Rothia koreensis TaxID=592378 RepID=UPI0037C7FBE8